MDRLRGLHAREPDRVPPGRSRHHLHVRRARRGRAARLSRHGPLPPGISVAGDLDLDDLWDRFEVFEALHHPLAICNPLTTGQLDEVVDALDPTDGDVVLDVACGSGELLLRAAARASIRGIGIDLSPWMVTRAHQRATRADPNAADLRWVLGDARRYVPEAMPDIAVCIGAEWVWHDFGGTARALKQLANTPARVAVGAGRLHLGAAPDDVAERLGRVGRIETVDDQRQRLAAEGLRPLARIDATDDGWDAYLAATADAAAQWAADHPGPRADRWLADQAEWHQARERDRELIGWSVWVATTG